MKKLLCILLTLSVLLSLTACGSGDSAAPDKKDEKAGLTYPYNLVNQPMKVNDVYDYKTICYDDPALETNGHIYIYDYIVEPVEDGMVDKTVKAMFIFDDDNAWNYGMSFDVLYADFANDTVYGGEGDWTVQVDGKDYPVTVIQDEFISGEWTPMSNFVSKYVLTIRMPEDYDDIGLFFYNSAHKDNVQDEDGNIPDGTLITSLVDSHSQWFVLGGKGADWEETKTPTYFGQPIEAQANNIAIEDVLGGTPVFDVPDDVDEDGAPPADMMEDFSYIEISEWSHDVISTKKNTELQLERVTYNWFEGDVISVKVYTDDDKLLYQPEHEITSDNHSFLFLFEADKLTGDNVYIEMEMKDNNGVSISSAELWLPIE